MRNADRFYSPPGRGHSGPSRYVRTGALVAALLGNSVTGAVTGDADTGASVDAAPISELRLRPEPMSPTRNGPSSLPSVLCDAAASILPGCATAD